MKFAQVKTAVKRFAVQALDGAPPQTGHQVAGAGPGGNGARAAPAGRPAAARKRLRFRESLETTDVGLPDPARERPLPDVAVSDPEGRARTGALYLLLAIATIGAIVGLAMVAVAVGIKLLIH